MVDLTNSALVSDDESVVNSTSPPSLFRLVVRGRLVAGRNVTPKYLN